MPSGLARLSVRCMCCGVKRTMGRRPFLAQAAAAAGSLLTIAATVRPVRRGLARRPTLTVAGITAKDWIDAVTHAWQGGHPEFDLAFRANTACDGGADLFVMREEDTLLSVWRNAVVAE